MVTHRKQSNRKKTLPKENHFLEISVTSYQDDSFPDLEADKYQSAPVEASSMATPISASESRILSEVGQSFRLLASSLTASKRSMTRSNVSLLPAISVRRIPKTSPKLSSLVRFFCSRKVQYS